MITISERAKQLTDGVINRAVDLFKAKKDKEFVENDLREMVMKNASLCRYAYDANVLTSFESIKFMADKRYMEGNLSKSVKDFICDL